MPNILRRMSLIAIAAILLALTPTSPSTLDAAVASGASVLERVEYRHNGAEHQEIAEVMIADGSAVLRLFSEVLSNHYEVRIELSDLISSTPLDPDEAAAIIATRNKKIAVREKKAEEARARRAARRAEEERRGGRRTSSSRKNSARARREKEEVKAERLRTVQDLVHIEEEIGRRINDALNRSVGVLESVVERRKTAREQKRPLRLLAGSLQDARVSLGMIASSLENRRKGRLRLEDDLNSGALHRSEVPEQIEYVEGQYDRLEGKLQKVERTIEESIAQFARIPEEEPLPDPEEEEERPAVRPPAKANEPEPRRARREVRVEREDPAPSGERATVTAAVARVEEPPKSEERKSEKRASEEIAPAASTVSEGSRGGGLPIWPLYLIAFACLGIVWRGARRPVPTAVPSPEPPASSS